MKILFVEDDECISEMAKLVFMSTDYDVILCPSPKTAIQAMKSGTFEVLILDMNFPDGTGEEVLNYISSQNLKIKVIVHTGYTKQYKSIIDQYTELGIIKMVYQKPNMDFFNLSETIKSIN